MGKSVGSAGCQLCHVLRQVGAQLCNDAAPITHLASKLVLGVIKDYSHCSAALSILVVKLKKLTLLTMECQEFPPDHTVISFSWGELLAEVRHDSLRVSSFLGQQYVTNSIITGIAIQCERLQGIWVGEHRGTDEGLFEFLKSRLGFPCRSLSLDAVKHQS